MRRSFPLKLEVAEADLEYSCEANGIDIGRTKPDGAERACDLVEGKKADPLLTFIKGVVDTQGIGAGAVAAEDEFVGFTECKGNDVARGGWSGPDEANHHAEVLIH